MALLAAETDSCLYNYSKKDDDIKIVEPTEECNTVYCELAYHVNVESKGPKQSFLGVNLIRTQTQHSVALNQGVLVKSMG